VGELHLGCSGWNYRDWRDDFYPPKLPARQWLDYYSQQFDTVEVNATFYRLPAVDTVATWAKQTPSDFVFAVKSSRYLTHVKRLAELDTGVKRFYERIEPLVQARKLGPILWQLPATFHRDDERLAAALDALPPGRHAFEFRHESWFADDVFELLRAHDAALVVGDHPQRPFQTFEPTARWVFVRFHFGRRGRNGNYSERELDAWAQRLGNWLSDRDVYAYFNNDWKGYAPRNASSLRRRLEGTVA
jgi:uncharacterized protein YecE (DUF72 family)